MHVYSFSPFGYEGFLVTVEVDLRRGIPAVDLVGLADNAVREARERMRAAIRNSGFAFPAERILISLSPADVKKEGAGFDLAIALSVLSAQITGTAAESASHSEDFRISASEMPGSVDERVLVMGELELSGRVRPVRGVNAAVSTAAENRITRCIVPLENETEARTVNSMSVYAVESLAQAYAVFLRLGKNGADSPAAEPEKSADLRKRAPYADKKTETEVASVEFPRVEAFCDFESVRGRSDLVRALQIAAAGRHNLIAYGPPGCGKTLAFQRYPFLLPLLEREQLQTVARIYSLAGFLGAGGTPGRTAPFRAPHQSATVEGIIGGGTGCRPGEISLAHNGTLFLDEAVEFRANVLQSLRVPLETGRVTLSRAGRHTTFPADFQLLVAANPCPCGNFGSMDKICVCSPRAVETYWKKFSAPLLDRIDIRVPLFAPVPDNGPPQSTARLRLQIACAVIRQKKRQHKPNSRLFPEEIEQFCGLSSADRALLEEKTREFGFSVRAVHSCLKLARTIADMDVSDGIRRKHLEEAVGLRKNEGGVMVCF